MTNGEFTYKGDWNDHEFAKWLRERGWADKADTTNTGNSTSFLVDNKVVALVFYDNARCAKKVYIKEGI